MKDLKTAAVAAPPPSGDKGPIKHVDQSLHPPELQDLPSGKDTVVRHSYIGSQNQSSTNRIDTASPTKFGTVKGIANSTQFSQVDQVNKDI